MTINNESQRSNYSSPCKNVDKLVFLINKLWCKAQQTPPPAARQTYQPPWTKSAATKRVQTRCPIPLAVILITNKLTFDPPTHLPEFTLNLIRSSHGHSTPSLKISCKSVQPFSRNVADKETKKETKNERKKQRKKQIARKQYPVPLPGAG